MEFTITPIRREEIGILLELIRELAVYERMEEELVATEADYAYALFEEGCAKAVLAKLDGKAIGYAVYFRNFSTFLGRSGIYLEDLYVQPAYRGKGYGKALFTYVGKIAAETGCKRYEWTCLDWNEPSRQFYQKMGAVRMEDWTVHRLTGEALESLRFSG